MIATTPYPDLIRFINPQRKVVREIPLFDGFILIKDLTYKEVQRLKSDYTDFIALTKHLSDKELGREEIIAMILKATGSRRKPKYEDMEDSEFESAAKMLYAANYWPEEEDDAGLIDLFMNVKSKRRFTEFFRARETMHPNQILYALMTFASRCKDPEVQSKVSGNYFRIIKSSRGTVSKNLPAAVATLARSTREDPEIRALRFLDVLGEANG